MVVEFAVNREILIGNIIEIVLWEATAEPTFLFCLG